MTISPEISESFDQQANMFASEVLFQLDTFQEEARGHEFGIRVPLKLSKKYGASVYATIRRYVSTNDRRCAVIVLNPPELAVGKGFMCSLRRVVESPAFLSTFGPLRCPSEFTPDDRIGKMVPWGDRKMSKPARLRLTDQNGVEHNCIAEAFRNKFQIFILVHETEALIRKTIFVR